MADTRETLAKRIKSGECILFLGAGVHAAPPEDSPYSPSYPPDQRPLLGAALADELAKGCNFSTNFPSESARDLQRVSLAFEIEANLGRKELITALQQFLMTGKKFSPALEMLARLPFRIIVTTNYDRLLETALRKVSKDPHILVYNPDPPANKSTPDLQGDPSVERPLLFKMHGDLETPESVVITDEDYIRFVQRMADGDARHPVPHTVRFRMQQWPTLFVGYSLRDFDLRLLFRTMRWGVDDSMFPKSFSVDRRPDELTLQVWQNKRGIVTFVTEDLWALVPWLFKEIQGKDWNG